MIDYSDFLSKRKSMMIAPAGYGKTHYIANCLEVLKEGKQLVLTHTHAGVSSIKKKLKAKGIANSKYNVETLDSFAQKYAFSFSCKDNFPSQEERKEYYPFVIEEATRLVNIKPISDIIKISYAGLFVDEYQDCSLLQHKLILALGEILPTRIFGDHLQGIFGFNNGSMVDLTNKDHMREFLIHKYELDTPWRWKSKNETLGETLKEIRSLIENSENIDLNEFHKKIEIYNVKEDEIFDYKKDYSKTLSTLRNEKSLLVIHPVSENIEPRLKIIKRYPNAFRLLEAIDEKKFYSLGKYFDNWQKNFEDSFLRILKDFFTSKGVDFWFNSKGAKRKTDKTENKKLTPIRQTINLLEEKNSFALVSKLLTQIEALPKINYNRKELLITICKALDYAEFNNCSVFEAVVKNRNKIRRIGRSVEGRFLGTTLLTKGLEFDTVAILNAHQFDCPKNLYVAMTRASNRLIIFSQERELSPYTNN